MECSSYARIPLALARVGGLTERCFRVVIVLATSAGDSGRTWIGNAMIAEWAGLRANHVQDALKRLADLGIIERPSGKRTPQTPLMLRLFDPIPVDPPLPRNRQGRDLPRDPEEGTPVHPQIGGQDVTILGDLAGTDAPTHPQIGGSGSADFGPVHPQIGGGDAPPNRGYFHPQIGGTSTPKSGVGLSAMKNPMKTPMKTPRGVWGGPGSDSIPPGIGDLGGAMGDVLAGPEGRRDIPPARHEPPGASHAAPGAAPEGAIGRIAGGGEERPRGPERARETAGVATAPTGQSRTAGKVASKGRSTPAGAGDLGRDPRIARLGGEVLDPGAPGPAPPPQNDPLKVRSLVEWVMEQRGGGNWWHAARNQCQSYPVEWVRRIWEQVLAEGRGISNPAAYALKTLQRWTAAGRPDPTPEEREAARAERERKASDEAFMEKLRESERIAEGRRGRESYGDE